MAGKVAQSLRLWDTQSAPCETLSCVSDGSKARRSLYPGTQRRRDLKAASLSGADSALDSRSAIALGLDIDYRPD